MRTHLALILIAGGLLSAPAGLDASTSPRSEAPSRPAIDGAAGLACPALHFEENRGQTHDDVRFVARARGYSAFLTHDSDLVLALRCGPEDSPRYRAVRMSFPGAREAPRLTGTDERPGRSHYFLGEDEDGWVRDVPHLGGVTTERLYPGIDVRWRGADGGDVAYDFAVAPGADPTSIRLAFEGDVAVSVDPAGDLVLRTPEGELRHTRPLLYQEIDGRRRLVDGRFVVRGPRDAGFAVGSYDESRRLVIDPEIKYSTYLGGGPNTVWIWGVAVDSKGRAVVAGHSRSASYPTSAGAYQSTMLGAEDLVLTKFDSAGSDVVFSTFVGGTGVDTGTDIALDGKDDIYLVGHVGSGMPTKSPIQASHGGGPTDGYLAKFAASGSSLVYATYHGGGAGESYLTVDVDSTGAAYVAGVTGSKDFPTKSPIQATYGGDSGGFGADFFLSKFNPAGSALVYSTFIGGTKGEWIPFVAVNGKGAAYVVGRTESTDYPTKSPRQAAHGGGTWDVTITKVNAAGSAYVYSTYHGGDGDDYPQGAAVDTTDNLVAVGRVGSSDFPLKNAYDSTRAGNDAFVSKFKADGSDFVFSTLLGGSGGEMGAGGGVGLTPSGNIWIGGATASDDFPTVEPVQGSRGGKFDAFLALMDSTGQSLLFSTYLGGDDGDAMFDLVVDQAGAAVVVGSTKSSDFPTKNAYQAKHSDTTADDGFVTKFGPTIPPNAPEGLTAVGVSDVQVDLAWDAVPGAAELVVERAPTGGPFAEIATVAGSATSYADTTAAAESSYDYRLLASNSIGPSDYSDSATATTGPAMPTGLAAQPQSNTRIDLMWTDASATEVRFEIERKLPADADYTPLDTASAGAGSYADTTAQPETTYLYVLRAVDADGAPSRWTDAVEATTPPADPKDVIPTARSDAAVLLRWKDLSAAETGYELERGIGCPPASFSQLATTGADVVEFEDRSVAPETTYGYRIRAVNANGHSEWTPVVCITTPPRMPTAFAGTASSPSRIRLSWTDNSDREQGYEVQRTLAGRDDWEDIADLPPDATEYLDVGVSQEAAFSYRVRAYDDNGRSRNALAEGVSTPAALVVRSAKLTIPTGRAAKRKKPTLVARGEMDVGGTQVDFEGSATLWVGDTQVAIGGFDSLRRGKLLRYDEDGIRLDLKPSAKGASRVPFSLRVVGDVAAALGKDGELFLRFRSGAFDAMGVVTLAGGQFNPARGKGTWIDPELNLLMVAATPKRKSFKMRATFPPDELPGTAPEVSVLLDIFEISFEPGAFKQRGATKYVLSRKLGSVRQKVILDYRRGTLTIVLSGVALQSYEPGTVLVPLAVSIGSTQLQDKPLLVVTKRSFRY